MSLRCIGKTVYLTLAQDHAAKERIIIDKGTTVNQQTHHHVHHVIQPVIQKESENLPSTINLFALIYSSSY